MGQLAAKHLAQIRQMQSLGPYRVVGFGLAGLIAHEIAFKLLGEDEQVEFLGLVDSRPPTNAPRATGSSRRAALSTSTRTARNLCPFARIFLPSNTLAMSYIANGLRLLDPLSDPVDRDPVDCATQSIATQSIASSSPSTADIARRVACVVHEELRTARHVQASEYSSVLPIQTGRKGATPIYCVPGAGANVTSFMPLAAALGDDIAIAGLDRRNGCVASASYVR